MAKKKKDSKASYAFRSVAPAKVEEYANEMAEDGWVLDWIFKDNHRFWLSFSLPAELPKE